jgi:hypothetical protein
VATLREVHDVWSFVQSSMPEEQTASFAKGFKVRFGQLCEAIGISPVPTKHQDWYHLDINDALPEPAERKLGELRNWLKGQSPEFARSLSL